MSRRKMLAVTTFRSMWSLWLRRQHVSERLRLRLNSAFVRPVLIYKAGTWGLTGSETDKVNAFHRKQLRLLIGIKQPQRISNSNLYERCECREISTDVMDMRWRLFGHVLRFDEKAPAHQAYISKRRDFKDICTFEDFSVKCEKCTLPTAAFSGSCPIAMLILNRCGWQWQSGTVANWLFRLT